MTRYLILAAGAAFATSTALAAANDIGFNPVAASQYCNDLADSYQVLDEDRGSDMVQCVAAYEESPPGEEGSDVSPHAVRY